MFINTQLGGMNLAFPDVCLTPVPFPVPIPYPNIDLGLTAVPTQFNVLIMGGPAHNMATQGTISNGDNAGVNMGVMSGMVMGPRRHLLGAFNVLVGGMPATRFTDMTGQNGMSLNAVGATLVPAQFSVMAL